MAPPLRLSLGLRDGSEVRAPNLTVHNASCVTATLPPLPGATSFAWADVAPATRGRTAFLTRLPLQAGLYVRRHRRALVALVLLAGWAVPAYLRASCEQSARARHEPRVRMMDRTSARFREKYLTCRWTLCTNPGCCGTLSCFADINGDLLLRI